MGIATELESRLSLPVIAAPMTGVSGPELVSAACRNGVIGSFPTHNAPTPEVLDEWLDTLTSAGGDTAPVAPNLVVHPSNERLVTDLALLVGHRVEIVITSVGSPAGVVGPLHEAGCAAWADVATLRQAEKAIAAGVDGLVLLSAGAGGQTGKANPFAFVRAVREMFDGTVVLAGGISDGTALLAARVLGADLAYMGTPFIATVESQASPGYRSALVESTMDDVRLSDQVGGLPASLLSKWLDRHPANGDRPGSGAFQQSRLLSTPDAWSAGHGVSAVKEVTDVATLLARVREEYEAAIRARTCSRSADR